MQNAIFHAFFYRIQTPLNSQILIEISFSPICKNALFDVSAHSFNARFYVFFSTRNHIAALLRHNFPFCIFEKFYRIRIFRLATKFSSAHILHQIKKK